MPHGNNFIPSGWIIKRPLVISGLYLNVLEQPAEGNILLNTPYDIKIELSRRGSFRLDESKVKQFKIFPAAGRKRTETNEPSLLQIISDYFRLRIQGLSIIHPELRFKKLNLAIDMLVAINGSLAENGELSTAQIAGFQQRAFLLEPARVSEVIAAGELGGILNNLRLRQEGPDSAFAQQYRRDDQTLQTLYQCQAKM